MNDAILHVRVDVRTKRAADQVCQNLGIPLATACRAFVRQIVSTESIPLRLHAPAAMREYLARALHRRWFHFVITGLVPESEGPPN